MKQQKIYHYAVMLHPTVQEAETGKKSEMIVEPKLVLGSDDKAIFMQAVKSLPDTYEDKLDQIEVIIRPF